MVYWILCVNLISYEAYNLYKLTYPYYQFKIPASQTYFRSFFPCTISNLGKNIQDTFGFPIFGTRLCHLFFLSLLPFILVAVVDSPICHSFCVCNDFHANHNNWRVWTNVLWAIIVLRKPSGLIVVSGGSWNAEIPTFCVLKSLWKIRASMGDFSMHNAAVAPETGANFSLSPVVFSSFPSISHPFVSVSVYPVASVCGGNKNFYCCHT